MSVPETFLRYELCDKHHMWACIAKDRSFAVHIWAQVMPDGELFGGVEQHRIPREGDTPEYVRDGCCFLSGPCWHDGSSLAFDEYQKMASDAIQCGRHSSMFAAAEGEFVRRWLYLTEGA